MDELQLVLLGLRSIPKEDLGCAHLLHGARLLVLNHPSTPPGEFFEESRTSTDPSVSELPTFHG